MVYRERICFNAEGNLSIKINGDFSTLNTVPIIYNNCYEGLNSGALKEAAIINMMMTDCGKFFNPPSNIHTCSFGKYVVLQKK